MSGVWLIADDALENGPSGHIKHKHSFHSCGFAEQGKSREGKANRSKHFFTHFENIPAATLGLLICCSVIVLCTLDMKDIWTELQ